MRIGGHEVGSDAKCLAQQRRVSGDEHAAAHGRGQPLVRIDGERVRQLDACEEPAQPIRAQRRPTPCGIDVAPQAVLARDLRTLRQRIDHAAAGGAGRGRDEHRHQPLLAILGHALRERARVHAAMAVGGNEPQRGAPDTGLVHDLEPGGMTFARGVHGERGGKCPHPVLAKSRFRARQRAHQRGVVRLRAAGGEMSRRLRRQAGAPREGTDDVCFDLDRRRG